MQRDHITTNNNKNIYPPQGYSTTGSSNRHHAHPEYYTSVQPPMAKKNKKSTHSSPNRAPPVPAILTSAASFDSGITSTAGQSPGRPGRSTVPSPAANINAVNAAQLLPRSLSGPIPTVSQHVLSYSPPGVITSEGYSYHMGPPPSNRNNPYGEIYYPHPNIPIVQHGGIPSDPFLHYPQAPPFQGHHYYPYIPPWHHLQQNAHDASSLHLPPMVVSSSSVVNPTPVAPVEYVTELREHDVLSGRGGATNSYRGNRAFRILVKEYQDQYLKAKKRDKPAVASLIVETIRKRGGRFLRRDTSQFRRRPNRNDGFDGGSMIQWVDIGDERAREKTCQALREGAPEIRRQGHHGSETDRSRSWDEKYRSASSFSFEDDVNVIPGSHEKASMSSEIKHTILARPSQQYDNGRYYWQGGSPTGRHDRENVDTDSDVDDDTPEVRNGGRHPVEEITFSDEEEIPVLIRPWSRLLPDRAPVEPIGLHQLSVQDRDMYLREFLPPNPRYEIQQHLDQHVTFNTRGHFDGYDSHFRSHVEQDSNNHDMNAYNHDEKKMSIRKHGGKGSQWPLVTA